MPGGLTVVGTPIGNLGDLSPRAAEALRAADLIAAEDTRVTLKLLSYLGLKKPMVSYFEHNKRERGEQLCARMEAGEACVLVSDAGMPAISDPGEDLVRLCAERGIPVTVVPGPSALTAALAVSGLATGRFTFEGFLSMNKKNRRVHLQELTAEKRTMVFYEAPHKLFTTLCDLREAFGGERRIALVRELTKIHEEVVRTTLEEACARFEDGGARGEFVLVVDGCPQVVPPSSADTLEQAVARAETLLAQGCSASEAAKCAAKESGISKGEIYKRIAVQPKP
jgi:16S rRNA (cytidine1402-2'-O)-methyltransferase